MISLGIEIGGTKLQVGVGGRDGKLASLARRRVDPAGGADGIRAQIPELVDEALARAEAPLGRVAAVAVGFGGPVDTGEGRVLLSHQIGGWAGFPLRQWLSDRFGRRVVVQNDAKCAAYAEARVGAGRGSRRIFYMTIGSGVGGGLVTDGRIDEGQGLGAAEIGHTWVPDPEKPGALQELELVASGWSIARRAGAPDGETAYRRAEAGDARARRAIEDATDALALSLSHVLALLHPERIVLGGGVASMGPLFWDPLRAKLGRLAFKPFADRMQLVPAALGEPVVVVGATLLGLA